MKISNKSFKIWHDMLLKSIKATEKNVFFELKLNKKYFIDKMDIDLLIKDEKFIKNLKKMNLNPSQIYYTDDYNTFVNKPCKFLLLYNINDIELDNPKYILFQSWNNILMKWSELKLYEINDDINKFFNILISKTMKLKYKNKEFIYKTNNTSEWKLIKGETNNYFKKYMRTDDIIQLLDKLKIIVEFI